ncbi:hypothetical protein EJB05_00520, partial [Eragrostis curvula]
MLLLLLPLLLYLVSEAAEVNMKGVLTVGEVFSKTSRSPVSEFLIAACKMVIFIGASAGWAFTLYDDPIYAVGSSWRLAVIMLWSVYMAVIAWMMADMIVHMPYAPVALWEDLFNVGWLWIGISAVLVAHPVVYLGWVWMQITLSFLFAILIAGVIAFWVWLRRTYGRENNNDLTGVDRPRSI